MLRTSNESIFNTAPYGKMKERTGTNSEANSSKCVVCKGAKMLCGKSRCPIIVRYYNYLKIKNLIDTLELCGSSPPNVFIGRFGYPKVQIGPLIPPIQGDTSVLGTPELWIGKSIDEIVGFRSQLVRGKYRVNILKVESSGKIADLTRELALSKNSADVEAEFFKKPKGHIALDDEVQPYGPSAPLKKMDVSSLKIDHRIEKVYSDEDLKAKEGVLSLFNNGVLISQIQRAFSVGAFGLRNNRRFVPTRWSITAVDSTISKTLVEMIKDYPLINQFRVYESWELDNRFLILMIPRCWSYELIEAWYPQTIWNPSGHRIVMFSDHEKFKGRTTYAKIGGCYYAARLAVSEHLIKERRQAEVIILREAHPGYIMPVGVWNVRENVRNGLRNGARKFDTLEEALSHISSKLDIRMKSWLWASKLLTYELHQKRIDDW